MAKVYATRTWPVVAHGLLGVTLALGYPTIAVCLLGRWDAALGPNWSWSIPAVVLGGLAMAATMSFALGMERAPFVAVSDQRKLAMLGPGVLTASLAIALLVGGLWTWILMAIGQGFFVIGLVRLAFHFQVMKPAANEPRCASCGYLLDGLESARCPECGTPFPYPGRES